MLTITRTALLMMTQVVVVLVTLLLPIGKAVTRHEAKPLLVTDVRRSRHSGPEAVNFELRIGGQRLYFRFDRREPL